MHIPLFLAPLYCIIFFNIIAFVMVIRVLILQKRKRARKSKKEANLSSHLRTIASIFSIMIVYGIFWLTGVFSVAEAAVFFMWPFLLLNVSQGIIIFLLIGIFNTYNEWRSILCKAKKKEAKTSSAISSNFQYSHGRYTSTEETSFSVIAPTSSSAKPDEPEPCLCRDPLSGSQQNLIEIIKEEEDCSEMAKSNDDMAVQIKPKTKLSVQFKTDFD